MTTRKSSTTTMARMTTTLSFLLSLNLTDNDVSTSTPNYRKLLPSLLPPPSLRVLDSFSLNVKGLDRSLKNVPGIRDAVEAGDSLSDAPGTSTSRGLASMEKEFDDAMKGHVDSTVVS